MNSPHPKAYGDYAAVLVNRRRTASVRPVLAFTLIELLVTLTIISILGSLTLAGLAVARQRVKASRTESTIRKIHEVVMPHFERLMTRSLPPIDSKSCRAIEAGNGALELTTSGEFASNGMMGMRFELK